jgi:hypothetical protein
MGGTLTRVRPGSNLGAVFEAVAVRIGAPGVGMRPVLTEVREPVSIGIALRRALLRREVVALLPLVWQPIAIAITGLSRGRCRHNEREREYQH